MSGHLIRVELTPEITERLDDLAVHRGGSRTDAIRDLLTYYLEVVCGPPVDSQAETD